MNFNEQQAKLIQRIDRAKTYLEELKKRQKIELGEAVLAAGLSDLDKEVLISLLQQIRKSTTE